MDISKLYPSFLDNCDFTILAKLADIEFNDIELKILELNKSSVDVMKKDFLRYFCANIGLEYSFIDPYMDRGNIVEVFKNFIDINQIRGTAEALEYNSTYANIDGHILNNLFCFGDNVGDLPEIKALILPREMLFTWSRSVWSGEHKRAGTQIYKEGVVIIEINELNSVIQEKINKVAPAGMQVLFKIPKEDGTYEIIENYIVIGGEDNE